MMGATHFCQQFSFWKTSRPIGAHLYKCRGQKGRLRRLFCPLHFQNENCCIFVSVGELQLQSTKMYVCSVILEIEVNPGKIEV